MHRPLLEEGKHSWLLESVVFHRFDSDLSPWHDADRKHRQITSSRCGIPDSEACSTQIPHKEMQPLLVDIPLPQKSSRHMLSRKSSSSLLKALLIQQASLTRRKSLRYQNSSVVQVTFYLTFSTCILWVYPAIGVTNTADSEYIIQPDQFLYFMV